MNNTSPSQSSNPWKTASWTLILILGALSLITAGHYGDSWDEDIRSRAGEEKLAYYQHLLSGNWTEAREIGEKRDKYPGFHDLNLAILKRLSPLSEHHTGNLFSSFLGVLCVTGAMRLGWLLKGYPGAFWTGLLLVFTPTFYGHMFINPKDIPFACGYVWSLAFMVQWLRATRPSPGLVLLTGMATGITMASRVGGAVLLCYLGLFVLLKVLFREWNRQDAGATKRLRSHLLMQVYRLAGAAVLAFAILLVYWPYAQVSPFSRTGETLQAITSFDWNMPVLFEGAYYTATELPFYYILKMFLLKIPLLSQLLFFAGVGFYLREIFREWNSSYKIPPFRLEVGLVLFSIIFPLAYVLARDSILYNGLRHLLFIIPPACFLAAIGLLEGKSLIEKYRPGFLRPAAILIAAGLLLLGLQMIRLHPYQYVYYNALAGGPVKAADSYESDYWGTVYKELAEDFYQHLATTHPEFSKPEVVVNMEHVTWLFAPFLPEPTSLPIRVIRSQPEWDDYYAASTSWSADEYYFGETVVEVKRMGLLLGVVKDRRQLTPKQRILGYPNH